MKILVVDDETDMQTLFEQRFRSEIRKNEIQFSYAFSGEEALSYLQKHPSEVILILSDINMPGMSGIELLRRIRLIYPVPPPMVMMITAYGNAGFREEALELGANDFITKPVDFNDLKEKLKSFV
jgi:CheY-like chemotaxis protein